ncbi:MAG: amidohydrolase family protein [Oscillospiraceae bacterium]|jgi:imidazolonepropionase-like amidohydrolase|nr:amidohydrolase family protein [Oscillospiraceae bacterium]
MLYTLYNANIITVTEADIENGYLTYDGDTGKITDIGGMDNAPDLTEGAFDCKRGTLMPGFIDAHCHVGGFVLGDCDDNEVTDPITPHLRAIDSVSGNDEYFIEAAGAGVTTILAGVGSANPIGGTFVALRTGAGKSVDERIIKETAAMKFAFGENPKRCYEERDEAPNTRMATAALIREALFKAKKYLGATEAFEYGTKDDEPDFDMKCEALLPVLNREVKVQMHCHRADDIFTAIRIGKEFNLDFVLIHATDGELIAKEIAASGAPCVVGPVISEKCKQELKNHSISLAATLTKAGVKTAICTDHPVVPIQYLPLSAGLAIRGGLTEAEALAAITKTAAEVAGLIEQKGTLEVGKDADLVLFAENARFFDVTATPVRVVIEGKICQEK